ncbi:extensin-like domain-containing protein [Rhodobacter maris]|nr:extensin family protein [Rhodobacter maris]
MPQPEPEPVPDPAAPPPAAMPGSLFRPGVLSTPKPLPRPAAPAPRASGPASAPTAALSPRGALCGTRGIEGTQIAPIKGEVPGCGLSDGVKVTAISGIPFSDPLTIDCATAQAMKTWIDRGIVPAVGRKGGGIARIEIFASYTCRPRNNQRGAKLSEHGQGRAVDFGGVTLKNGRVIDVLTGWKSEPRMLRAIHAAACGPFGTVLGPKSDRFHLNHIHVDTAYYRSGPYCR